ncbi:phage tail terminator protein [Stenotrophomonas maltophilia]|uniref:phage tail terminator protein n=1 Tax=Stenotrophomonas maltophilia TaxID=40324 RepID=UPI0015DE3580|nr:hypothetical protein [Stenotrophomonas maltophilia]
MTVGPFPVGAIVARLQEQAKVLLEVGSAADLSTALEQQPKTAVAAFVTSAEVGKPSKYSTNALHIQNVDVTIRVVLFVRNYAGEATGAGARDQMDKEVIPAVRQALVGWTPVDAFDALSFQAGRDEAFKAGWLVNQQVLTTNYRMQVSR